MTRSQARCLHATTALVGLTGLVYAYMRYLAEPEDPFALVNHPREPLLRDLHIVFAPLLVFACGWVWQEHVWKRVRSRFRARRASGLTLFVSAAPMILSGYFLQVSAEPLWRDLWIVVHLLTSAVWLGGYLLHQLAPRRASLLTADRAAGGSAGRPVPAGTTPPPGGASKPDGGGGGPARS